MLYYGTKIRSKLMVEVSFSEHLVTAHCNSPRRNKIVEASYRVPNSRPTTFLYDTLTPGNP